MVDLRITNVQPVLSDGSVVRADILVDGEHIAGVVEPETTCATRKVLDGGGHHLLPGLIDTHVHIGLYDPVRESRTETASAGLGGITTTLRFYRSMSPAYDELFPAELALASANSYVDFAFHLGILIDEHLEQIQRYHEEWGIRSFKMYTAYRGEERKKFSLQGQDDGFILDVFRRVASIPGTVAIVHSENNDIIERETGRLIREGQGQRRDLEIWEMARPVIAEVEAVSRMALLAEEARCPLFIPHVSSKRALQVLADRKASGQTVYIETLIAYLVLDTVQAQGVYAAVNPPVRAPGNSDALWKGVQHGIVDVVATDHCPTPLERRKAGAILGCDSGHPGLGSLLPGLLSEGVSKGRIGLDTIARMQSRAAEIFHLPTKGAIRPGADADLVLVDLGSEREARGGNMGSIAEYSPFEGMRLRGWPVWTMLRGQIIAKNGLVAGRPGYGRYLRP